MKEMDDFQFDKTIRNKTKDYEAPGFDPQSLAALHYQMASHYKAPWLTRYRRELLVATGLLLFTAIIILIQWRMNRELRETIDDNQRDLKLQRREIAELRLTLSEAGTAIDTVWIPRYVDTESPMVRNLFQRIAALQISLQAFARESDIASSYPMTSGQTIQFTVPDQSKTRRVEPRHRPARVERVQPVRHVREKSAAKLSPRTIRQLEKHRANGIGIFAGPSMEFSGGAYSMGSGSKGVSPGLMMDMIISPSFSLEIGLHYHKRYYEIDGTDFSEKVWPGHDPSLGPFEAVEIDSWMIEQPLNLKYHHPLNMKNRFLIGLGYSNVIYTRQELEYIHYLNQDPSIEVNKVYENSELSITGGTVNVFLGYRATNKRNRAFELTLNYKKGIEPSGIEQVRKSYFGFRGVYWWKLR